MAKASRVGETSTSTSSAIITLGGAISGLRTVASKHSVGETGIELVISDTAGNWLEGVYTFTSAGPTVMTRTAILGSSNADGDVTFPAGSKTVQETASATFLNQLSGVRSISFTSALPFTFQGESYMPQYNMSGPLAFTIAGGAVKGAYVIGQIVGDGANTPTWDASIKDSGGGTTYDVRSGYPNKFYVWYDGFDYQRQYGQVANASPVPTPATALAMTGPTGGIVSQASTAFSIAANGTLSGTVTWTAAESGTGAAGTFTPTSGTTPGSFTYTPGSTGAKTISITNNGGLMNPTPITYTVTAAATAPGAPTIGTATAGDGTMTQAGTAPTNNGGAAITSYQLKVYKVSDNTLVGTFTNATLPVTATGLTNGTAVYGKLAAINSVGTGAQSAASNNVTPAAAFVYPRINSRFNIAESGTGPYGYTGTGAGSFGSPSEGHGVLNMVFQSGVDGSFAFKQVNKPISLGDCLLIGLDATNTVTTYANLDFALGFYDGSYKIWINSPDPTNGDNTVTEAAGDWLRVRRVGSTLYLEVSKNDQASYNIVSTRTGVSTGLLYGYMISSQAGQASNLTTVGLA